MDDITVSKEALNRLLRILGDVATATEVQLEEPEIDRETLRRYINTARVYAQVLMESAK